MTTPGSSLAAIWLVASRRLGVLVVLAGVLAMHALAGGSHMTMAGATDAGGRPAASTAAGELVRADAAVLPGMTLMTGKASAGGGAVPQSGTAPQAAAAHPDTATASYTARAAAPGLGVETACLAVLLGLVLIAARTAVGVPPFVQGSGVHRVGHSSAPLGRGSPGRLLAQLCVLRT